MALFSYSLRSRYPVATGCILMLFQLSMAVEIDRLLKVMSNREKIGQMILVYHSPYEFLEEFAIGGVLIMADKLKKPEALEKKLEIIQERMPIGLLVAIDQEGGKVNRLSALKKWKTVASARKLASFSEDTIVNYISNIGKQLKALHINTNLAPVLDPSHNWKGEESFMSMRERSF